MGNTQNTSGTVQASLAKFRRQGSENVLNITIKPGRGFEGLE